MKTSGRGSPPSCWPETPTGAPRSGPRCSWSRAECAGRRSSTTAANSAAATGTAMRLDNGENQGFAINLFTSIQKSSSRRSFRTNLHCTTSCILEVPNERPLHKPFGVLADEGLPHVRNRSDRRRDDHPSCKGRGDTSPAGHDSPNAGLVNAAVVPPAAAIFGTGRYPNATDRRLPRIAKGKESHWGLLAPGQ